MNYSAAEIAQITQGTLIGDGTAVAAGVCLDSRRACDNDLFLAFVGEQVDGHQFVLGAAQNGASIALVQRQVDAAELAQVIVADVKTALWRLAADWRARVSPFICALTGSNGKTTVKEILASIFSQVGPTHATLGNLNNDLGVPLTLLRLTLEDQFSVIELGANAAGEIAALVELVRPDIALVNNSADAHLEGFGSREGVIEAKGEIFDSLTQKHCAIVNRDDLGFRYWTDKLNKQKTPYLCFSSTTTADVTLLSIKPLAIETKQGVISAPFALNGAHNAANATAAVAAALAANISLQAITEGLSAVTPVPGRLAPVFKTDELAIFDDTYNANPGSVDAAFNFLAEQDTDKIMILGEMAELGPQAKQLHQSMVESAKKNNVQIFCRGAYAQLMSDIWPEGCQVFESEADVTAYVDARPSPKTVVVKGSRSAGMERTLAHLLVAFGGPEQ